MKYLEALLAREATRSKTGGDPPWVPLTTTDITDKSTEATNRVTFVSNVGNPPAHNSAERPVANRHRRPANAGEMDLLDLSAWESEVFQERAAIMEFDGGLDRAEAERRAFVEVFVGGRPTEDA